MQLPTLAALDRDLAHGSTTSRALVEAALVRIADPGGEGSRTFIRVFNKDARAAADVSDGRTKRAEVRRPLEGIPISIKDLCDVAGVVTLAGSTVRAKEPPATRDAVVVERLRKAGAVIVGTTNMNEFAMGTPGTNPHYGTPRNPWDRATGRVPGGSSSGAAVSVADGMSVAALGSDTAGSIRVPASLCGLVGFKPTARRVPLAGVFPLSPSLDSVGPIAASVACCATFDAVLADEPPSLLEEPDLPGLRLGALTTLVLDSVEPLVARVYERALDALRAGGAAITDIAIPELSQIPALFRNGGITIAEAYRFHRPMLDRFAGAYDPIVERRLRAGSVITDVDYQELMRARAALIRTANAATAQYDALLMPTCPMVAPPIADVADVENWQVVHRRLLYPNAIANMLDRCALTIPLQPHGEPPVGLTILGETLADHKVLQIGAAIERILATP
ncbi:MAG TPA: amidase [Gemmatimonadaceae bacterium]|nr:amidase [Gemmatimonadaceae bacterium]